MGFNGFARKEKKRNGMFLGYSRSPRRAWPCPVSQMVVTLGVVPARLCLTLPRTTPRLRVLIPISPFKFLWYEQHAGQLSIGQQELCSPREHETRETIRPVRGFFVPTAAANFIGISVLDGPSFSIPHPDQAELSFNGAGRVCSYGVAL